MYESEYMYCWMKELKYALFVKEGNNLILFPSLHAFAKMPGNQKH